MCLWSIEGLNMKIFDGALNRWNSLDGLSPQFLVRVAMWLIVLVLQLPIARLAVGQCSSRWVSAPGVLGRPGGFIETVLPLSNGDLVFGGDFQSVNNAALYTPCIARYNATTSTVSGFGLGFDGVVRALTV